MAKALRALVKFYRTGEDADRVAYDIAWVHDKDSPVDTINGFIEVYMDPRGIKGSWEALVYYVNRHKTENIRKIAAAAQWFEDHMPWLPEYRKEGVRGVTASAIDVVVEAGESAPMTPVGINLPNDQAIRETHGSKSVSLSNVNEAYEGSTDPAFRREFAWTDEEAARAEKWSARRRRTHHRAARSDRPWLGQGRREAERRPAERAQGAVLGARRSARRPRRAVLHRRRKMVELGIIDAEDHDEIILAEYRRATRATRSRSCGACAKARRSKKTTCATAR